MIGRVLLALAAEWEKLRRRAIGWASLIAAVTAVILSGALARLGESAARLEGGARAVSATNGYVAFADGLKAGTFIGAILLVIFAGILFAEEIELGTAKVVFSKPVRRVEVVIAKGLLLLALSLALVLASALASFALAALLHGFGDVVERSPAGEVIYVYHTSEAMRAHALRAVPLLVPPLFAALSLAFLFSTLSEQSGIAVGLAFGALVTASTISFLVDRVAPWLVTSYFGYATDMLRSFALGEATASWDARAWPRGPSRLWLSVGVSAATALLAWTLASVSVARRRFLSLLPLLGGGALLLGPLAGSARAEDEAVRFTISTGEVRGQVWDVDAADLDQDGRQDLLVFHVTGRRGSDPKRFLSLYFGRDPTTVTGGAHYLREPDQTLDVPNEAVARFAAELDPRSPGLELCFLTTRGLMVVPRDGRRYDLARASRPLERSAFYDIAPGTQLLGWSSLVRDVNGDGRRDILFPEKGRYRLFLQGEGGAFLEAGTLEAEFKQYFGTRVETLLLNRFLNYWAGLNKPALVDLEGDRREDAVMFRDGGLDVFFGRAGVPTASASAEGAGLLPRDPDRRMPLKIISDGEGEDDSFNSVNASFEDVDRDGLLDLILYRNVGKVGLFESLRTQVLLHRARAGDGKGGKEGLHWPENPDQIVNLLGMSINPALIDVDRDGDRDLVLSSLRTDLITNAKRALFSSVTITYYVFRFDQEKKRFSEVPDYERDLTIDVARIEGGGTIPLAIFRGDYDGDGFPDLLSLESTEEVRILPGKLDRGFFGGETLLYDEGRERRVALETSNSVEIDDLNRDGKSDIVFWYFSKNWESEERGIFRAAVSR